MSLRTFDGRPGLAPDLDSFAFSPGLPMLLFPFGSQFPNESEGPGISRLGAETAIKLQRGAFWQRCSSVIFRRVTECLKKALGVDNQ